MGSSIRSVAIALRQTSKAPLLSAVLLLIPIESSDDRQGNGQAARPVDYELIAGTGCSYSEWRVEQRKNLFLEGAGDIEH